ncbi:MAG: CBS domain-containing protein [Desulfovibrionales bacterium]
MEKRKVKEFMVPLGEYANVGMEATVLEAIQALSKKKDTSGQHKHTTVLVMDENGTFVSRLTLLDLMAGLEPKYRQISEINLNRFGYSRDFLQTMLKDYNLWEHSLEDACKGIPTTKISAILPKLEKGEYISANATLDIAVHQMIMTRFHSLLVTEGEVVVGIVRSIDLFRVFLEKTDACEL